METKYDILPIILAGGSGTRLWPMSRQLNPKQFLSLTESDETMLQTTISRISSLESRCPIVLCNEAHRFIVAEQLRQLGIENSKIILEPYSRNTAPAIAISALLNIDLKNDIDPVLLVLSADHLIEDNEVFNNCIDEAIPYAIDNKLVTFGIKPNKPETGYGYIKKGSRLNSVYEVEGFFEKPNLETALQYMESEDYFWNSGIFMFKASTYLNELKKHSPNIYKYCELSVKDITSEFSFIRIDKTEFEKCPNVSIDYAVMEKTDKSIVIELKSKWSDIGSWEALWDISDKNTDGNVLVGDILVEDSSNCYINSKDKLVTVLGVKDLIIVNTKDALLVSNKSDSQKLKNIVSRLAEEGRIELYNHSMVQRPWGNYEGIDKGPRYQVKRITVKPGGKLSVQKHFHRAEHWIVVSGTAQIENGDKSFLLSENQSTYIPAGVVHSLQNPGKIPLEIIEVQSGAYLGEDDIVRYEDKYGRV